jgi:hypothetical protein
MARMRFLATSTDARPGHEGVTYGPGHETDFIEEDYDYILALRQEGKAEIIDATGLPTEAKARFT